MIKSLKNTSPYKDEIYLRPNLMPISFSDSVQGFINAIKYTVEANYKESEH